MEYESVKHSGKTNKTNSHKNSGGFKEMKIESKGVFSGEFYFTFSIVSFIERDSKANSIKFHTVNSTL